MKGSEMKSKLINLYEVRVYSEGSAVSRNLSRKCRIVSYRKAQSIVRRLKKFGVDAVVGSPWKVRVAA
jgi:hypothetical protein